MQEEKNCKEEMSKEKCLELLKTELGRLKVLRRELKKTKGF
jgi:hypothetical protein